MRETAANEPSLEAMLQRAKEGDQEACRTLIEQLQPLVFKVVRAYRARHVADEDLAQTVFMKIFAHLQQYNGQVPIEHWVSRIAVNSCLKQLRREQVRPELRWAVLESGEHRVLEELCSSTEQLDPSRSTAVRELVDKLLETLAPADRLVVQLLHLEGRSMEEIKHATGWNIALIKVRAFRARQRLRKAFGELTHEQTR